jgi:hypothetical protein
MQRPPFLSHRQNFRKGQIPAMHSRQRNAIHILRGSARPPDPKEASDRCVWIPGAESHRSQGACGGQNSVQGAGGGQMNLGRKTGLGGPCCDTGEGEGVGSGAVGGGVSAGGAAGVSAPPRRASISVETQFPSLARDTTSNPCGALAKRSARSRQGFGGSPAAMSTPQGANQAVMQRVQAPMWTPIFILQPSSVSGDGRSRPSCTRAWHTL